MSGRSSAKGSSPMMSRAHQTAWPRPMRRLLAGEADGAGRRLHAFQRRKLRLLAGLGQRVDQFRMDVEIVLDHLLVAAGHEDDVLDAGLERLVDGILHDGTVDDGQHFLRHRLGGRQEPRSEPGDRYHGFSDFLHRRFLSVGDRPARPGHEYPVVSSPALSTVPALTANGAEPPQPGGDRHAQMPERRRIAECASGIAFSGARAFRCWTSVRKEAASCEAAACAAPARPWLPHPADGRARRRRRPSASPRHGAVRARARSSRRGCDRHSRRSGSTTQRPPLASAEASRM